jgi:pyruvate formate lyase activating enzyme
MGVPKWEKLGIPYSLKDVKAPTTEEIQQAEKYLKFDQVV